MASLTELVTKVVPYVPEAPNPAIKQAVFDAYFEFCKSTRFWVGSLYPTMTDIEEPELYLDLIIPGHARVYDILVLSIDGKALEAGDFHRAQALSDRSQRPKYYSFRGGDTITLYPTPDKEYKVTGEVILVPRSGTDTMNQVIIDNFEMGIRHGAIYTLASMRNKPWTDPQQAQDSLGHFAREMENARNLVSGRDRKKIRITSYGGL